ncbi:hypothetical protein [Lichenibacterium dinghuense]|uniref:hypothetical protein n=1 Tax=Lichenibacterium dinghuense TaxID=2895977 RepID=UPI001F45CAB9|nr:hypothetical protein [Lichenibacterium sp. 6Y81]
MTAPGIALGSVLLLCGTAPLAAQGASRQADEDACRPDVFRLCVSAIRDEAAIVRCLEREAENLSPACRAVIAPEHRPARRRP